MWSRVQTISFRFLQDKVCLLQPKADFSPLRLLFSFLKVSRSILQPLLEAVNYLNNLYGNVGYKDTQPLIEIAEST